MPSNIAPSRGHGASEKRATRCEIDAAPLQCGDDTYDSPGGYRPAGLAARPAVDGRLRRRAGGDAELAPRRAAPLGPRGDPRLRPRMDEYGAPELALPR